MRLLIAPQELKGTLTAVEGAAAVLEAVRGAFPGWQTDALPMADGGPGTVEALVAAGRGELRRAAVHDALMRPVEAVWGLLPDGTAVIEWAAASGLWRLRSEERDARRATSYGTGELLRTALDAGCREIVLGFGGSATNDGGAGLAQALGYRLLDADGIDLPPGSAALSRLHRIDATGAHPVLETARVLGATDVSNPLCGPDGASATYGPQKGADPAAVAELDAALDHFADVIERDLGRYVRLVPGAGAAGGGGAGAIAFLNATLSAGAEIVGAAAALESRIAAADIVLTAEGRLDGQTGFGKGPLHVARLSRAAGRPVVCIAGSFGAGYEDVLSAFDVVEVIAKEPADSLPSREEASRQLGETAVRALLRLLETGRVV